MDFGASRHVCSDNSAFINMMSIHNSTVTLSGQTSLYFQYSGDIFLGPHLVLHNALYVRQFKFNLILASALTNNPHIMVVFYPNIS